MNNITFSSNYNGINASTTTASINQYGTPSLVETKVLTDSIELTYIEEPLNNTWPQTICKRVFKTVYNVVDGKWNQSERIYGQIFPAKVESYGFDQE